MNIDPNIQNVVLGIIANALTSLIAGATKRTAALLKPAAARESIDAILKKSAEELAEKIEWKGPGRIEEICLFLTSPEVEQLVRQVYSVQALRTTSGNGSETETAEMLKSEFASALSLFTGIEKTKVARSAEVLLNAIILSTEELLQRYIDAGLLGAHDARSNFQFRIVRDELTAIRRNTEFLNAQPKLRLDNIIRFEEKYRKQVASRSKYLVPPHLDSLARFPSTNYLSVPIS